jgi:hypothetical protein
MASPTYPCPNPTCAHSFGLDAIKGASSLTCPRCGTMFQFRSQPAAAPPSPVRPPASRAVAPVSRPPAPNLPPLPHRPAKAPPPVAVATPPPIPRTVPMAVPVAPAPKPIPRAASVAPTVPMAVPVASSPGAPSPDLDFSTGELISVGRRGRGRHAVRNAILYGVIAVIFLGGGGFAAWWLYHVIKNQPTTKDADDERTGNFAFTPPEQPWEEDRKTDVIWPVRRLYRRGDEGHVNNMAIYIRDYKDRTPGDGELVSGGLSKLRAYFRDLEYELKPRNDRDRLADRPALRLEFQGVTAAPENVFSYGECYMMSYRGFAYWFITWGPESNKEVVQEEWPKLREHFRVGGFREGWADAPRKTRIFRAPMASYQIEYYEKVWSTKKPEDYDPRADLALLGNDPRLGETQRHESKRAIVLVLMLDKAANLDEAIKKAEADLLERQKQKDGDGYLYPDTMILDARDDSISKSGKVEDRVGAFEGRILRKEVKNTDARIRHVVLGVVPRPEGVLVISCECNNDPEIREKDPEFRDYWDQEFTALLKKVGPKKGG